MEREKEEQKKRTTITRRSTINYSIITVNREAAYYTPIATMPTEMRPCWNRISTYQQFSFLIDARSDCRDRAITISSVNRVMMILFLFLFCSWSLIGTTQHNTTTKISVIIEWKYYAMDTKEWTLALPEQFDINNFFLTFFSLVIHLIFMHAHHREKRILDGFHLLEMHNTVLLMQKLTKIFTNFVGAAKIMRMRRVHAILTERL